MSHNQKTFFMILVACVLHASLFLVGKKTLQFVEVHLDSHSIHTQISMSQNFVKKEESQVVPLKEKTNPSKKDFKKEKKKNFAQKEKSFSPKNTNSHQVENPQPTRSRSTSSQNNELNINEPSTPGSKPGSSQVSKKIIHKYIIKVRNRVDKKKQYPAIAKANQEEGQVVLKLKLSKTGRLLGHQFQQKTEYDRLNRAAQESLLKASSSFPPFPKEMENLSELTFTIPVNFSMRNKG